MKKALLLLVLFTTITTAYLGSISKVNAVTEVEDGTQFNVTDSTIPDSAGSSYISDSRLECDVETQDCEVVNTGLMWSLPEQMLEALVKKEIVAIDKETGDVITDAYGNPVTMTKPGAIASAVSLNGHLYENPPASGLTYAQNEWNKIKGTGTVYAAPEDSWIFYPGLGFEILEPIQDYWAVSRNLAYAVMIIIIIVVALMVLFRGSFGGQTQVTIANSIPNIIIALIMITLSYALSGLAIDFITIGVNATQQVLVQNTFSPGYDLWTSESITTHPVDPLNQPIETLLTIAEDLDPDELGVTDEEEKEKKLEEWRNDTEDDPEKIRTVKNQIISVIGRIPTGVSTPYKYDPKIGDAESPVKYHLQPDDQAMSIWSVFGTANIKVQEEDIGIDNIVPETGTVVDALDVILESLNTAGADYLISVLFTLVLAISAFMASIKLFFKLLTKYIILALYPIISPFVMLTIAIPGMGTQQVAQYFKVLFSAALSFVAIYAIFLFMVVLTTDVNFALTFDYSPSLIGLDSERLIGDTSEGAAVSGQLIKNLIAYGLFVSTPIVPDYLDKLLTTPDAYKEVRPSKLFTGSLTSGLAQGNLPIYRFAKRRYEKATEKPRAESNK
ncbi:hypothetical protein GF389_03645 [Candidatus Dojkabacteria bacterium]|nr:hypothetical protein [Candidatus Dojkabacteria bacterium]